MELGELTEFVIYGVTRANEIMIHGVRRVNRVCDIWS